MIALHGVIARGERADGSNRRRLFVTEQK